MYRTFILVFFLILTIIMISISSFLSPSLPTPTFPLRINSPLTSNYNLLHSSFSPSGPTELSTSLSFGISGYDPQFWGNDNSSYWDPLLSFGGPIFDIRFEI